MFCKYCGALLDDDAVFCEKCGKPVAGRKMETVMQKREDTADDQGLQRKDNDENEAVDKTETLKKKRNRFPAAGIIALILIAVIGLAVLSRRSGGMGPGGKAPDVMAQNNFHNGGIYAYDDTRQFFIGPFEKEDKENVLYSTDREGNDRKILSSEEEYDKIRVTGDQLLVSVCDLDTDRYELQIMNKDGSDCKTILKSSSRLNAFDRSGEKLIYLTDEKIHLCSLEGEDDQVIAEGASEFICIGDVLYCTAENEVYSYDLEKTKKETVINGTVSYLCYENGKLFYKKDGAVYEMDLKDNKEKKLADADEASSLLILDDTILAIHTLSYDELKEFFGSSVKDEVIFNAIGAGYLVKIPKDGGDIIEEKNAYGGVRLFGCPDDIFCQVSLFSNNLLSIKEIVQGMK